MLSYLPHSLIHVYRFFRSGISQQAAVVMATSGYATEELHPSQTQGGSVTTSSPARQKATSQYPADIQSSPASAPSQSASIARVQTTPTSQKKPALATPPPGTTPVAQYVTGELQSSASQSGNGQSAPQFIVVTVTGEITHRIHILNWIRK